MNNKDFQIVVNALAMYSAFMRDAANNPNENKDFCQDMAIRAAELQIAITEEYKER